ncbi:Gypsy retrotransposon integrase-like protein 1 [Yamadazyma tenuis]|uniref:Zn(2)-C6 fungal-type domain-containing protein n=1 Tax=Candida tenuis (strain ATCC 10573 / BCRC 21748 / CBS 615 / JCM 9827 / NBRC 10315 / NRRL Y-1498 / VKM Y-70) TaxID=590646 RepID=G3B4B3_CANTC|nr:uncharacterized protein CANTEDRAFT_104606 [Yamadazyma tenuis ATCC 10573]EGV63939.1 hypothetical protein CANTEDRAFT_104606 [Yamadazyma tenuis ATCC 10573]WEJ96446.1 Gypsy retrotransposon integrase-like protein 1 [Yamadazyma tenuis]
MNFTKLDKEPKRRRVTRACDICRQKKVKCDGKQPCIHCTVYSYNCTYDQPNIRNKKNSGIPYPPYSRIVAKNGGSISSDPAKNATSLMTFQNIMDMMFPGLKVNVLDDSPLNLNFEKFKRVMSFLQQSRGSNTTLKDISDCYLDNLDAVRNFSPSNSPWDYSRERDKESITSDDNPVGREIKIDLPSKEIAVHLIQTCWDKACVLFRFYHRPSLLEELDLLYSLDPLHYTDRQQKFLPFLYSILAVGCLFSRESYGSTQDNDLLEDDGFKYFLEARKLIDITNVGDIISIQTIVMMIMYLQCSARLSTCYSYIGIGLRSALKEGLHRNLMIFQDTKRKLDPIEIDTRKRLFFTLYKMDIYINSLLGLPKSLSEDEFDQMLPEELDDENITRQGYHHEAQQGRLSSAACANHHTKLMFIMSHIITHLYPLKVKKSPNSNNVNQTPNYMHQKVSKLEHEMKQWLDQLPEELKPYDPNNVLLSHDVPEKFQLANYYLHLAFLNCQIMLYRPFIHFISHGNDSKASDPRSLIRGRNCIKVARSVVKLANRMIDQNLLVGTYWFSMYTIFFSIACLIYYYHFVNSSHNLNDYNSSSNYAGVLFDDDLNLDMIKKDIEVGKKVLDNLKGNSNASLRIYNILNQLFEQLNRRTASTSKDISNLLTNTPVSDVNKAQISNTISAFDSINNFKSKGKNYDQTSLFQQNFNKQLDQLNLSDPGRDDNQNEYTPYSMKQSVSQPVVSVSAPVIQSQSVPATASDSAITKSTRAFTGDDISSIMNDYSATTSVGSGSGSTPAASNSANPTNYHHEDTHTYIPGVMDTLDAQIFGRILPPYMQGAEDLNLEDLNELIGGYGNMDNYNFDDMPK